MIKLLIVDDHPIVRDGLKRLLEKMKMKSDAEIIYYAVKEGLTS